MAMNTSQVSNLGVFSTRDRHPPAPDEALDALKDLWDRCYMDMASHPCARDNLVMDQVARPEFSAGPIVVGVAEHGGGAALAWAVAMASALDRMVVAVHAFDPRLARPLIPSLAPPPPSNVPQADYDARRELFEHAWCAELDRAEVPNRRLMIDGDAVDVLSEVGEREGASMIVICSRGHGALAELIQESVSHELIHRAVCPVVVVPPG
jgi:nucleotide-binding universal stress UspA family protein